MTQTNDTPAINDERLLRSNARIHFVRAVDELVSAAIVLNERWRNLHAEDSATAKQTYPFGLSADELASVIKGWRVDMSKVGYFPQLIQA